MSKLETVAFRHLGTASAEELKTRDKKELAKLLDEKTPAIIAELTPGEIVEHTREVYDATVGEYANNPHTKDVVDELIEFMGMIDEDGEDVLDVGCGTGRDTLFMSCPNRELRFSLMQRERAGKKTIDKYPIPVSAFKVVAMESSFAMATHALKKWRDKQELFQSWPLLVQCDMHQMPGGGLPNPLDQGDAARYDGIWSCTAMFTHTPKELIEQTIKPIPDLLKPDGVFALTYTNGRATGVYDKLLLSSTGRIKYFSQPDPQEIILAAQKVGLRLYKETFSDYEMGGKVIQPNLFVAQFFKKS